MQFPESWLREYCNPKLTTQELADTLTMAGLEVEELAPVAPPFTGIVVGEIKEAVQRPDADRLRICQVDVGGPELLNIVCGAPNARAGITVVYAPIGAYVPGLDVTLVDIKRAGDYEPWHGPRGSDIRIMRDIYPPRITLQYTLKDASGRIVDEGEAKLSDTGYLHNLGLKSDSDPLRYEKRLIDDWVKRELSTRATAAR